MDWSEKIEQYKLDTRVSEIHRKFSGSEYQPDMSLSTEIRGLLSFTSRHGKDRVINGPEDLATAEQILNEVNQYRDRAIEIHLSCLGKAAELERAYQIIEQVVLVQPEIQGRGATDKVKDAIVGQVAGYIGDIFSQWKSLLKQSEILFKNCRSVYDNINLQVEVAKQMWFQERNPNGLTPQPPTGYRTMMSGGDDQQTTTETVSGSGYSKRPAQPLAGKLNTRA